MTNSAPPPVNIPNILLQDPQTAPFYKALTDSLYELWYSLGGQQDGVIFSDRVDLSDKTTDDLPEGSTNFYYTEARFNTSFALKDTDDLSEGSTNLYYTQARFDTAFAAKDTDDLAEGTTNLYYTSTRQDDIEALAFFMGA